MCRAPLGLATRGIHLPGRTQSRARARAEKGSAQERRPLGLQDPALPESSGPGTPSHCGPSERPGLGGRRAGARLRVRVSSRPPGGSSGQWAAEKEQRRPATKAAEDPLGAGSRDANSAGAEPGASDRRRRHPPSPAERTRVGTVLRPAGRWHRRQHPKLGAQAGREAAAAAAGGARPPRGSQQWCSALARSPRPPRGRRGSGRETPPATRSPEFARPASPAGAPLARQRPRRLSPEHGAGARLSLIAPLPPPLAPPVPPVPPVGAASGFSARGSTTLCLSKETGQ